MKKSLILMYSMNFANFTFAKLRVKSFAFREILKMQKISNTSLSSKWGGSFFETWETFAAPHFGVTKIIGSNRHRFWAIAIWNLFLNNTPCTVGAKGTQRENTGSWIVCKTHSYLPQPQRVNLVLSMDKLKSFIVKIESHILWYSFIYLFLGSEKLKKYFINFIWTWTMNFNVKKSKNSNSCPLIVSLKSIVSCF